MDEYRTTEIAVEDVQSRLPALQLSLSRVGVTAVEKVIRVRHNGREQLFSAQLECFVDLGPRQKGAHMSRFEEVVNEAIGEVILGESAFRAETLAQLIAERVRERQDAHTAEVTINARYPEHKPAPVSGIETQEIYTLHGSAVAGPTGTRRMIGVTATGMTACPCAQDARPGELARAAARAGLLRRRDRARVRRRPGRHAQPARHRDAADRLPRGLRHRHRRARLVEIVEASMSSEIYELMKRSDEAAVVEKAHRRPRFVEDCVREMIGGVLRRRSPSSATTRSSPRGRRTSSRSTSTTSWPSASGCSASCAPSSRAASPSAHHVSMREWLDGAATYAARPSSLRSR